MAHGLVETPVATTGHDAQVKPPARSRTASRSQWWQLLLKVNGNSKTMARRHLDALVKRSIVRIGLRVECADCQQPNWYALGEIKETLRCERCLQSFDFPVTDPPTQAWHYRTQGPFSIENYAHGSYSVALALRFLITTIDIEATWTPSLKITGPNQTDLECDFAIWRRNTRFGTIDTSLLFGECKSFDEFKARDIARAKKLAETFPDQFWFSLHYALNFVPRKCDAFLHWPNGADARSEMISGEPQS